MKFEDFLMQRDEEVHQKKRLDLEEEVAGLQGALEKEQTLNRILQCSLHGPVVSRTSLSSLLPLQVQVLLAELAMVEEEVICLERKVEELKLSLHQEKKQTTEWKLQLQRQWPHRQLQQRPFLCGLGCRKEVGDIGQSPLKRRLIRERNVSMGSVSEIRSTFHTINYEFPKVYWTKEDSKLSHRDEETSREKPNKLSEELIKCLISIFHRLNQTSTMINCESSAIVPRHYLSCMSSKGFASKTSSNCKTSTYSSDDSVSVLNPHGISADHDGTAREMGPYAKFIDFRKSSLDSTRISQCFIVIGRLRVLMHKLCTVDLSFLTHKQKLAFWINIYNACIMHAFLQQGLPPSPDKLLGLLNKAALNVGGIVLNALAIEHFILRHHFDSKNFTNYLLTYEGSMDEKEALLRHAYGLGYPEPNVTFALCRGSWSSPALRVYTAEEVVNELERAKVEYLEASIGFTGKKKILVPKLLHWHMRDFADDVESLLEWIYSHLPRSGLLKRCIMECLSRGDMKLAIEKLVEIQPYESEFRYLLPV